MAGKKGMDFIREYASAPERYLPLHSDWKGRVKEEGIDPADQDTDYGWSAGTIGNRFYSISRAAKVDEKCLLESHEPLSRWEELLRRANL